MKVKKKTSVKAKALLAISAAAAVCAMAVLVIILATDGNNKNPPDSNSVSDSTSESTSSTNPGSSQPGDNGLDDTNLSALIAALSDTDALNEIHSLFSGHWITGGDPFVGFVYIDGEPAIDYGLFQTGFGARGKIIESKAVSAKEFTLTIRIPAMPASEMNDATPERTDTVYVDVSNYNDNRLNIKIESLGSGTWHTYEYGGGSVEDAFNR